MTCYVLFDNYTFTVRVFFYRPIIIIEYLGNFTTMYLTENNILTDLSNTAH